MQLHHCIAGVCSQPTGSCRKSASILLTPEPSSLLCQYVQSCEEGTLGVLRQLAASERCVAIGECGLDFNRMFS